jgi:hypothetical protein
MYIYIYVYMYMYSNMYVRMYVCISAYVNIYTCNLLTTMSMLLCLLFIYSHICYCYPIQALGSWPVVHPKHESSAISDAMVGGDIGTIYEGPVNDESGVNRGYWDSLVKGASVANWKDTHLANGKDKNKVSNPTPAAQETHRNPSGDLKNSHGDRSERKDKTNEAELSNTADTDGDIILKRRNDDCDCDIDALIAEGMDTVATTDVDGVDALSSSLAYIPSGYPDELMRIAHGCVDICNIVPVASKSTVSSITNGNSHYITANENTTGGATSSTTAGMHVYIYTYVYIYKCICIYTYVYIYI